MIVDLFRAGLTLVTTASGSRHLVDASDPDRAVTVTRVTVDARDPSKGFMLADLRRDGTPIRLAAVQHLSNGELAGGVVVGLDMYLVLEPLGEDAAFTLRRTTPVVAVELIGDEMPAQHA